VIDFSPIRSDSSDVLLPKSIFNSRQELHTFLISLLFYFLIVFPILIADRYYVDDWGHALLGYSKWAEDGRPFTDFLMRILGGRLPLVDFSPLPQIGTIVVLSYLSVLIARKLELRVPITAALATLPLGANPFFLENLSFKFDSLPMALSVLLALLPILYTRADSWKSCVPGALLLFASLSFYQPSINAFIVFLILEFVLLQFELVSLSRLARSFACRILQLLLGLVLYRLVAALIIRGSYGVQRSAVSLTSPGVLEQNWIKSWNFIISSLWYGLRWPLILPIVAGAILILVIGIRYVNSDPALNSKRLWKIASIVALPVIPFLWLNAAIAVLLVLIDSPIGSCRTLIGMGALLASSLILVSSLLDRIKVPHLWICLLLLIPGYTMTMFASVYGNSLKEQKNYEMNIASSLSDDIYKISADHAINRISIEGNVGFSPFVNHNLGRFRLLGSLVSIDLRSDVNGGFARTVLNSYGIDVVPKTTKEQRQQLISQTANTSPVIRTRHYNLYRVDSDLIVYLTGH
jgi:hypothetical protein